MRRGVLPVVLLCAACASRGPVPAPPASAPGVGYSGMARLGDGGFLVVHDTKAPRDGARLGLVRVAPGAAPAYTPLSVGDWRDGDGRSSDLESVCALEGRDGEALAAESGRFEGRFGRLFHVRVGGASVEVLRVYRLPPEDPAVEAPDNFEGLACARLAVDRYLVILGERGGSGGRSGALRWGFLQVATGELTWAEESLPVAAPGPFGDASGHRDISALYLAADGLLWAAASEDAGDDGPFRSVIYAAARLVEGASPPLQLTGSKRSAWTVDGLKVEGLAAPATTIRASVASLASEDENLGGVWRPLFAPVGE